LIHGQSHPTTMPPFAMSRRGHRRQSINRVLTSVMHRPFRAVVHRNHLRRLQMPLYAVRFLPSLPLCAFPMRRVRTFERRWVPIRR
jgi:hypothetical protein